MFFGRDAEITELLDRLHPVVAGQAHRLVSVIGPSGAGKSSLVQAGVVPRLRQRRGGWIVVPPVVPGPLRSLTRSLAAAGPEHSIDDVPSPRFTEVLRAAPGRPNVPVLMIVDQAEELITLSGGRSPPRGRVSSLLQPRRPRHMERLSETIARQSLAAVDRDPDYSLLLALAALRRMRPTALAVRALIATLVVSQVRVILRGHDDAVLRIAWSPDGRRLATGSIDRTVRIWDADNGNELAVLHGHDTEVREVAWSPNGRRLATASLDRTARVWDADNGDELAILHGHNNGVRGAGP